MLDESFQDRTKRVTRRKERVTMKCRFEIEICISNINVMFLLTLMGDHTLQVIQYMVICRHLGDYFNVPEAKL